MKAVYDTFGVDYARLRQPDPRIQSAIDAALGDAKTVLNVGAGTGSYEPSGRDVTAVEPSAEMIKQRRKDAAPVVQGFSEDLPFEDKSFDASMATLTVHHWSDKAKGLSEMRRVTRGPVVILTYDPDHEWGWLADYFPEFAALDKAQMPKLSEFEAALGSVTVTPVMIPHDCIDGFLWAYWRRPSAYLDPTIRAAISSFWKVEDVSAGLAKLERDLQSGRWEQLYGDLLKQDELDCGYRLVSAL